MSGAGDLVVRPGATWEELAPHLRGLLHGAPDGPRTVTVATSGSSGTPKRVRLPGGALRASGEATAEVLGGHGRWVLALPTHHVAGLQVLARSALAGTDPVALDPGAPFTAETFADAVDRLGAPTAGAPLRLVSLVPTQLARLLDHVAGARALQEVDAVLLGGAAVDARLLRRARDAGTRVVTTYGMSETSGGCVYDGAPLRGVQVQVGQDGRVRLGGPVLADGYADQAALTAERFRTDPDGTRWFLTDDRGVWRAGRLTVLGRLDDVIVTGGHKVEPRDVEAALRLLPGVRDALVVGVPDPEWGQRVAALLVPSGRPLPTEQVRRTIAPGLPRHAVPRQVAWRDSIPLLESGKPDRAATRELLEEG